MHSVEEETGEKLEEGRRKILPSQAEAIVTCQYLSGNYLFKPRLHTDYTCDSSIPEEFYTEQQ